MKHQCVNARFFFWDGVNGFTVEYCYGINKWFVFNDKQNANAIFQKNITPAKSKSPNRQTAEEVLFEYFETRTT